MRIESLVCAAAIGFISSSIHAGPRTEGVLSTDVTNAVLSAALKEGYHFNDKAPNSVLIDGQIFKPTKLDGRSAEFANLPKDWKAGKATFYICDDGVTFCEPYPVDVGQVAATTPVAETGSSGKPAVHESAAVEDGKNILNQFGYIEDDYRQALAQAKKEKKLLLIDFSARWCPGCKRLEDEILPTKQFQRLTKPFVKLKIDMDRFENGIVSEKFKIKGIPTLLVVNADQQEVDRLVDYQPIAVMNQFFSAVKADPASLSRLRTKAKKKDPKVLLRLGKRLMSAGRYSESVEYLSQIKPPPPELLEAQVEAAGAATDGGKTGRAKYAEVLRKAIEVEPESLRSLNWRIALLGVTDDKEEKADTKKDGVSIADDFLKDREAIAEAARGTEIGEFAGFEPFMVGILRAELIEVSGAPAEEIQAAWRKAAQVARDLKIPPARTGASMRRLIVLTQAKLFDEADKLTLEMLKSDPDNPEVKRRRLRVLVELKNYAQAVDLGKDVLGKSYGRNEFWVAESLAKALIEAKRSDEAKELLNRYLARHEMDWPNMKDTRKKFEDLKQKVPKG